jgi:hypothetical protein
MERTTISFNSDYIARVVPDPEYQDVMLTIADIRLYDQIFVNGQSENDYMNKACQELDESIFAYADTYTLNSTSDKELIALFLD